MAQNENGTPNNLTEKEITILQSSWSTMYDKKQRKQNGIKLFLKLFKQYPASQDMFVQFRGVDVNSLENNKKLGAHALQVMYQLASYMDFLDDTDDLKELIRKTAKNHVARGVGANHFQWLANPIMELLEDVSKIDTTLNLEQAKEAWAKVLGIIVSIVVEEEKEKEK